MERKQPEGNFALNTMGNYRYIPALDGIICYAVLLVMILHGTYGHFPGGWVGVDLFFVLSGYLITGLLAAEMSETGSVRLGQFYIRRALRLLPALLCAILLAGMLWPVTPGINPVSDSWPSAAEYVMVYAANLVPGSNLGSLSHCWSLAVEEHYYLIWPPIFMLAWGIGGRKGAIATALIGAAGVIGLRAIAGDLFVEIGIDPYRFTLTRADSLLIGSMTALIAPPSAGRRPRLAGTVLALGIAVGVIAGFGVDSQSVWLNRGGYTLIAIASAVFVVAASQRSSFGQLLSATPLVWVGRRSYGIYLYHLPIFAATEALRVKHSLGNLIWVKVLQFGATLVIAAISYRLVESPFLALKGRMTRPYGLICTSESISPEV